MTILTVVLLTPVLEAQQKAVPLMVTTIAPDGAALVDPTDGYGLHDVHASWSPRFLRDVTLYASVNNLMNTRYEDPRFGTLGVARDVRLSFGLSF